VWRILRDRGILGRWAEDLPPFAIGFLPITLGDSHEDHARHDRDAAVDVVDAVVRAQLFVGECRESVQRRKLGRAPVERVGVSESFAGFRESGFSCDLFLDPLVVPIGFGVQDIELRLRCRGSDGSDEAERDGGARGQSTQGNLLFDLQPVSGPRSFDLYITLLNSIVNIQNAY
jgi:hypothetical protein